MHFQSFYYLQNGILKFESKIENQKLLEEVRNVILRVEDPLSRMLESIGFKNKTKDI